MLRPATVVPFCASHSFTAASICLPVEANGPVIGSSRPMRNGAAWARAPSGMPERAGRGQSLQDGAAAGVE